MSTPSPRERRRQKMARWTVAAVLLALVATMAVPALISGS